MASKMTTCKSCGAEISAKGKVTCPQCGRVNKKPIYKRVWFIVLVVLIVLSAIGQIGNDKSTSDLGSDNQEAEKLSVASVQEETQAPVATQTPIEPTIVTAKELIDALDENALKAASTYKGQYVQLTGLLLNIDAQGDYFTLGADEWDFLNNVHCSIEQKHLDQVMEFSDGQQITVTGTITDVGEVLGYFLDVDEIK